MHPLRASRRRKYLLKKIPSFVFSCGMILSTNYCLCLMLSVILPGFSHTAVVDAGHLAVPCQPGSAYTLLCPMRSILIFS